MPWENVKRVKTEDRKALFAHLKSIPAVKNQVPESVPPAAAPAAPPAPAPSK